MPLILETPQAQPEVAGGRPDARSVGRADDRAAQGAGRALNLGSSYAAGGRHAAPRCAGRGGGARRRSVDPLVSAGDDRSQLCSRLSTMTRQPASRRRTPPSDSSPSRERGATRPDGPPPRWLQMSELLRSCPSWWKIPMRWRSILTANGAWARSSASAPSRCPMAMGAVGAGGDEYVRRADFHVDAECARFLQTAGRTPTATIRIRERPIHANSPPANELRGPAHAAPAVSGRAGGLGAAGRGGVHALRGPSRRRRFPP